VNADGTLAYSFVEAVKGSYPFWAIRFLGGTLFLFGMLIMAYNMFKTMAGGNTKDAPVITPVAHHA
jgi:cytochrome c oxidase cbb3-type subunit 1